MALSQTAFSEWLDVTMSNNKIQGKDLAEAIGVHDSAVSRWRSGRSHPSLDAVRRIAKYLRTDPLRLMVTAGFIPAEEAGVDALPAPKPKARRESVRKQLRAMKDLSWSERQKLLERYEEIVNA